MAGGKTASQEEVMIVSILGDLKVMINVETAQSNI